MTHSSTPFTKLLHTLRLPSLTTLSSSPSLFPISSTLHPHFSFLATDPQLPFSFTERLPSSLLPFSFTEHPLVPHFSSSPTLQEIPTGPVSLLGQQDPCTTPPKYGWKFILSSFKEQTGHAFTKPQLKNKWDVCKKDWRIWTKLIGETGVGWSNELETIVASDEWWKSKIQENKGAKKFRQSGIEPSLKFKFDRMFSGVIATGQHVWAPSSGTVGGIEVDLDTLNVGLEGVDLEERSGD